MSSAALPLDGAPPSEPGRAPGSPWHVSPLVDAAAYHWSWALLLVPLLFLGERHPQDYLAVFLLTVAGNFMHQALTLPFVYLDPEVRARHRWRLIAVPLPVLALAVASLVLYRTDPRSFQALVVPVMVFGYAWNFWHVYMQKYGILRLHAAKSGSAARIPGWVDRLLVFSWLPLTFVVVGLAQQEFLLKTYRPMEAQITVIVHALQAAKPWLLPAGIGLVVASFGLFLVHEWRAHRLRNVARLSMGLGMTGLSASMLAVNPIKAAIAFGFSHVVEYVVFVWAVQRRQADGAPSASRFVRFVRRRPAAAFGSFALLVGGGFFVLTGWTSLLFPGRPSPLVGPWPLKLLLALLALHLSIVHFWLDGFLWKMRRPEVRAVL